MRIAGNASSVDPHVIGRFVDWIATPVLITISCAEQTVATHERVWVSGATITDPDHRETARLLRADLAVQRQRDTGRPNTRVRPDGHVVAIRALPDYDGLFGVNFDASPTTVHNAGGASGDTTNDDDS